MSMNFPTSPILGQPWPTVNPIWECVSLAPSIWEPIGGSGVQTKTLVVGSGLATSGSINLDLAALTGTVQTVALTGGATFTTSGRAAGRHLELVLVAGAAARTLAWPVGWQAFGSALPTSLAAGAVLRLAIECLGTTDADIDATAVGAV